MEILQPGFEIQVRNLLGVSTSELSDEDLNSLVYEELAEAKIKSRVPDYATITDELDLIYIQCATIYQLCALVCVSLSRRLNSSVDTMDLKWKKDKVDWDKKRVDFLGYVETALSDISSVTVTSIPDITLATSITQTYDPIGGESS